MKCKYMRSKINYTPNDYDLFFDFTNIPSNIKFEDSVNLEKRIAQLTPLSKKIHLNFNTSNENYKQNLRIVTGLKINNKEIQFI